MTPDIKGLVERLRAFATWQNGPKAKTLMLEAADVLERLSTPTQAPGSDEVREALVGVDPEILAATQRLGSQVISVSAYNAAYAVVQMIRERRAVLTDLFAFDDDECTQAILALSTPPAVPATPVAWEWPKVLAVKRPHNRWHGELSFAEQPTDEELDNLKAFLNEHHKNAAPVPAHSDLREALFAHVATFHDYDDGRPPLPIGFRRPTAEEIEARFDAIRPAHSDVREALEKLVAKLLVCHDDPQFKAVWTCAFMHGIKYSGATYTEELAKAQVALSTTAQSGDQK